MRSPTEHITTTVLGALEQFLGANNASGALEQWNSSSAQTVQSARTRSTLPAPGEIQCPEGSATAPRI
jgi:hypothetical protein